MKKFFAVLAAVVIILTLATFASAACTQAIPTQAKALFMQGAFDSTHTYKIALYTSSATYGAATTAYSATNESSGTGYAAGGTTLSGYVVTTSGTTAILDFSDPSWASSTITAACYIIYDDTLANSSCSSSGVPWVCCTGSSTGTCTDAAVYVGTFTQTSSTNGTFTVVFPTADASNGLVRIQ